MKAKLNRLIGAAALIAVLLVPAAMAQEKGSAKGGASGLLPPVAVYPGKPAEPMKCAACMDTLVTVPNREVRGGGARDLISKNEITVARHLCASCGTTFEVRGHGKAKRDVSMHVCGDCLEKAKATPAAVGAANAEVGKASGGSCCKDAWVVTGYQAKPRGYDPVPIYSLKHLCAECQKTAAR